MFYDLFKSLCDEKGVSVSRACLDMGLSRSIAAKWKNTRTKPSAEVLPKIASYFGVTTDYLLGTEQEKTPGIAGALAGGVMGAALVPGVGIPAGIAAAATAVAAGVKAAKKKKAPTDDGERGISDSQLMFALWGDSENVDEDDLDDVRRYAAFIKERKKKEK